MVVYPYTDVTLFIYIHTHKFKNKVIKKLFNESCPEDNIHWMDISKVLYMNVSFILKIKSHVKVVETL